MGWKAREETVGVQAAGAFLHPPHLLGNDHILFSGLSKASSPNKTKSCPLGAHILEGERDNKHTSNCQEIPSEERAMKKSKAFS